MRHTIGRGVVLLNYCSPRKCKHHEHYKWNFVGIVVPWYLVADNTLLSIVQYHQLIQVVAQESNLVQLNIISVVIDNCHNRLSLCSKSCTIQWKPLSGA